MTLRIIAFVIPLGFDTFTVAVALGLGSVHPLRPALLFALFETAMPLIGIAVGHYAGRWFATPAAYLGALIIIGIGLHTLYETIQGDDEVRTLSFDSVPGTLLAGVGISTDEMAMGFPLGASGLPIGAVLAAIAVQAFVVSATGIVIGRRIGVTLGRRTAHVAGMAAGAAFLLLGGYLLAERF